MPDAERALADAAVQNAIFGLPPHLCMQPLPPYVLAPAPAGGTAGADDSHLQLLAGLGGPDAFAAAAAAVAQGPYLGLGCASPLGPSAHHLGPSSAVCMPPHGTSELPVLPANIPLHAMPSMMASSSVDPPPTSSQALEAPRRAKRPASWSAAPSQSLSLGVSPRPHVTDATTLCLQAQSAVPVRELAPGQPELSPEDIAPRGDRAFVCQVCAKSFKRETNLMFHMATHRERIVDAETGEGVDQKWDAPTQCPGCPRVFATRYQAKKHFLRRHFEGEKRYTCTTCGVKSFTVKEDFTMHMRSCGKTFACSCGVQLRSQATLKRHCKTTGHSPAPESADECVPPATKAARSSTTANSFSSGLTQATQATHATHMLTAPAAAHKQQQQQPRALQLADFATPHQTQRPLTPVPAELTMSAMASDTYDLHKLSAMDVMDVLAALSN